MRSCDSILQLQLAKFLISGREQVLFCLLKCSFLWISVEELKVVWKQTIRESDWIMPLDEQAMILLIDVIGKMLKHCGTIMQFTSAGIFLGVASRATSFPKDGLSGRTLLAEVNLALEASVKEGSPGLMELN